MPNGCSIDKELKPNGLINSTPFQDGFSVHLNTSARRVGCNEKNAWNEIHVQEHATSVDIPGEPN